MDRKIYCFLIIIFTCCFVCCSTVTEQSSVEKEGKIYGVTKGAFRHRWWNYYERGCSFMEGNLWNYAESDFRQAVSQADKDERRARTYGMHFIDYFVHRELGITLFYQKRYKEAIQELENSLLTVKTAKAEYYLDKSRKELIEKENRDQRPPNISLQTPSENMVVSNFSIVVQGSAKDDTFVKSIRINGNPVRIDLSKPFIDFKMEIPIQIGDNAIIVEASDLLGKTSIIQKNIRCDRAGPILNIDGLAGYSKGYLLKGYAYDDSGLRYIRINGEDIIKQPVQELILNHQVRPSSKTEPFVVIAEDRVGNQTRALVELSEKSSAGFEHKIQTQYRMDMQNTDEDILIASLDSLFIPLKPKTKSALYYAMNESEARGKLVLQKDHNANILGNYYAFIVGINDYEEWKPLQTAVNDATSLVDVLIRRYGFSKENITLRINNEATLRTLIDDLMSISSSLKETDNLLIYFAGHGQLDKTANEGYWIPVEGRKNKVWSWIAHSTIKNLLSSEEVKGKNIIIITDSCYGGKLLRGDETQIISSTDEYQSKMLELASKKSRQIITSGGMEPVADSGRDNHSLFAYYFLKALEENTYPLMDLKTLANVTVFPQISRKGDQQPQMGRLLTPMDEDGEFIIALKSELLDQQAQQTTESPTRTSDKSKPAKPDIKLSSDSLPPELQMDRWQENQTVYMNKAFLEGKASDDQIVDKLLINKRSILRKPGKNIHFNLLVDLKEGNNLFIVECFDRGGNRAVKEINIKRELQKIYEDGSRISSVLLMEKDSEFRGDDNSGKKLEDMILKYMKDTGRFNLKELRQASNLDEAVSLAKKQSIDFIFIGKIIEHEEKKLEITVRVVDIETSDIITYIDVYDEEINNDLIHDLCHGLALKIQDAFPLVEGIVIQKEDSHIVVDLGNKSFIKKGMKLIVYQKGKDIVHPVTGKVMGTGPVKALGQAKIETVMEDMSFAVLYKDASPEAIQPMHHVITR